MNWRLFVAAAILVTGLLIKLGVPLESVMVGVAAAAFVSWWLHRRRTARRPD
jgi:Flp pilus assembly protein TadB